MPGASRAIVAGAIVIGKQLSPEELSFGKYLSFIEAILVMEYLAAEQLSPE